MQFLIGIKPKLPVQIKEYAGNLLPQVHLRYAQQAVGGLAVLIRVKEHQIVQQVRVQRIHFLQALIVEETDDRVYLGISAEGVIIILKTCVAKNLAIACKVDDLYLVVRPEYELLDHATLHKEDAQYRCGSTEYRVVLLVQSLVFLLFQESRPV